MWKADVILKPEAKGGGQQDDLRLPVRSMAPGPAALCGLILVFKGEPYSCVLDF